jgi:hypothetical protein
MKTKFEEVKIAVDKVLSEMFEYLNTDKPKNFTNICGFVAEIVLDDNNDPEFKDSNIVLQLNSVVINKIKSAYVKYLEENAPLTYEQKLFKAAGQYFYNDEGDVMDEYNKLLNASKNDNGEDIATNHADVFEPFEYQTVNYVLDLIHSQL